MRRIALFALAFAALSFTYTAHTGEQTVWISASHSTTLVYRSTALPINQ